jgi:hypothetical protein
VRRRQCVCRRRRPLCVLALSIRQESKKIYPLASPPAGEPREISQRRVEAQKKSPLRPQPPAPFCQGRDTLSVRCVCRISTIRSVRGLRIADIMSTLPPYSTYRTDSKVSLHLYGYDSLFRLVLAAPDFYIFRNDNFQ